MTNRASRRPLWKILALVCLLGGPPSSVSAATPTWSSSGVGLVGTLGSAEDNEGVWTVRGAGSDIWDTADSFHYVFHGWNSDGRATVRVIDLQDTNPFAKAGLMLRASVEPNAAAVIVDVKPNGEIEFMSRSATGAAMTYIGGAVTGTPVWLQLVWAGHGTVIGEDTVTASYSFDNLTWKDIGTTTVTMPFQRLVGAAVTSHDPGVLNTAHFDGLALGVVPVTNTDVGATGLTGNGLDDVTSSDHAIISVQGAGADIWGNADSFRFAYHFPTTGATSGLWRVASLQDTGPFAKAGLMLRDGLDADAANVILNVKPDGGIEFMARLCRGCDTQFIAGAFAAFPVWLRLTRSGTTLTGEVSKDRVSFTSVGSIDIDLPSTVEFGFAVTSHDPEHVTTAVFDLPRS